MSCLSGTPRKKNRDNGDNKDGGESPCTEDDDEDDRFFLMTPQQSLRSIRGRSATPRSRTQFDAIEQFFVGATISATPSVCNSMNNSPRKTSVGINCKRFRINAPIKEKEKEKENKNRNKNNNRNRNGTHKNKNQNTRIASPRHNLHQWSISTNMSNDDEHSLKDFIVYERAGGPCVTKRIYGPSAPKCGYNYDGNHDDDINDDSVTNSSGDDGDCNFFKFGTLARESRRNSLSKSVVESASGSDSICSFDSNKTFVMDGIFGSKEYKAYKAYKAYKTNQNQTVAVELTSKPTINGIGNDTNQVSQK